MCYAFMDALSLTLQQLKDVAAGAMAVHCMGSCCFNASLMDDL